MAGIIKVNQYQDFNGNTLFTSDGNGNLTTQEINYPAFDTKYGSSQTVSSATWTVLNYSTENFDTNNCYDNSTNYRFTPTVAGKYFLRAIVSYDLTPQSLVISIFKNGSIVPESYRRLSDSATLSYPTIDTHVMVEANGSTDYFDARVFVGGTPTASRASEGGFSGFRIGS